MTANDNAAYPSLPRVAVGVVITHAGKVLLIKRARAPRQGKWALPGGSVKLGETMQQAAQREVAEETGVTVLAREPVNCFDVITHDEQGNLQFHYIVADLIADYVCGELTPNEEVNGIGWFDPGALDQLDMDPDTLALIRRCLSSTNPRAF
ncbi:MAG TPA: NUDIX hydrolase [Gammaproteobacteria bacterium]|nr:NUDIX hydrolase [Gammaproteobacteria bacterium]